MLDCRRAADDGVEGLGAEKIVPDAVSTREPRWCRDVALWVKNIDRPDGTGIGNVETFPKQCLVEEPGASRRRSRRFGLDVIGDRLGRNGQKDALDEGEVDILVAEREGQVPGERGRWFVAAILDAPGSLIACAAFDVARGGRGERAKRRFNLEVVNESRIADEFDGRRKGCSLDVVRGKFGKLHGSKIILARRKSFGQTK